MGEELTNYFLDWSEFETLGRPKSVNGVLEPKGETKDWNSDQWKMHFMQVSQFYIDYANANIIPAIAESDDTDEDGDVQLDNGVIEASDINEKASKELNKEAVAKGYKATDIDDDQVSIEDVPF